MAYYDLYLLTQDVDFYARSAACYASETATTPGGADNPNGWVSEHIWDLASAPGFADQYASAIAGGVPNPGRDPAVISDGQILSAVQAIANN